MMGLISLALAASLSLVGNSHATTARSQSWNEAMPVAEAGLEEALAHLNLHGGSNLLCDSWAKAGDIYWIQHSVGSGYYLVTISNYVAGSPNAPIIDSRGYAKSYISTNLYASPAYLSRGVSLVTQAKFVFTKAITTKESINMNGNNVTADSFDSSNPLYSTNSQYVASKRKDHGDVATDASILNAINVGNATIYGKVSTGPNGTMSIGPQGSVGDISWNTSHTGVEPGYYANDMNVTLTDVQPPFNGGAFAPNGGWVTNSGTGTYYDYILDSGNYQVSTLSGSVYVRGSNAVIYVTGACNVSQLNIGAGSKLALYNAATSATINCGYGPGLNVLAANFAYFGLPSNTSMSLSGNGTIVGVVYAPEYNLTLNGGGKNTIDFIGSVVLRSLVFNGHFNFHYDEVLASPGFGVTRVVGSWREMTPSEVASIPVGAGN